MLINKKGQLLSISSEAAAKEALAVIESERNETSGLICRWPSLNRAMLKYWRPKSLIGIAGASGSAKSYIGNMIRTDLTDTQEIVLELDKIDDSHLINNQAYRDWETRGNFVTGKHVSQSR